MNPDKILMALESDFPCRYCPNEDSDCLYDGCYFARAATLIGSLQKQLAAKDAEIVRLETERAAMIKALRQTDIDCDNCKHAHEDTCENPDFDCGTCERDCVCRTCRNNSNWEWRGAKEDKP